MHRKALVLGFCAAAIAVLSVVAIGATQAVAEDSSTTEQPARGFARIEEPVRPAGPIGTPGIPQPVPVPAALEAPDPTHDPLLEAMHAELVRARDHLRLPEQPAPYFFSLWVQETAEATLAVNNGALLYWDREEDVHRIAAAQVRVGSYDFDNAQLSPRDQRTYGSLGDLFDEEDALPSFVPTEEDPTAIRTALWSVTDSAYKRALIDYQKKKALQALTIQGKERPPDFSREKPVRYLGPVNASPIDLAAWKAPLARATRLLVEHPEIQDAFTALMIERSTDYYVNTEGTVIRQPRELYTLEVEVKTQAVDGTPLDNFRTYSVRDPAELPNVERLLADTQAMAAELMELRHAEELPPYSGPALMDGEVAGVFLHEALGHRLEGERQRRPEEGHTFRHKIGERILLAFLTVVDDPTLERYEGRTLSGFYRYDSEGVPAQRVTLVQDGILKGYLMSRAPVEGFLRSNGHGRAEQPDPTQQPMGRMANLIVTSSERHSWAELKAMLLEEAKRQGRPYGVIIRRAESGETQTEVAGRGRLSDEFQAWKNQPVLVYRVDVETGREQLVRGVELVGTPLNSLERVIAAGDELAVFNGLCGAESGLIPVATVAPALLTAQVELQRIRTTPRRLPVLPSPFQVDG